MIKHKFQTIFFLLLSGVILLSACGEQASKRDFIIPVDKSATALTIGWYAPAFMLSELVGEYRVRSVNEKDEGIVMIFIVKSEEHTLDGEVLGTMTAAHLVIPVETPGGLTVSDQADITGAVVCPINIVGESQQLGDKYNNFGFKTYTGEIELDLEETEEKYLVQASIQTSNGLIEINSMFEKEGEESEVVTAMLNNTPGPRTYFYGSERMTRIKDGKGNLKLDGQNLIKALNLSGHPYFLRLDIDLSWEFDFVNEGNLN